MSGSRVLSGKRRAILFASVAAVALIADRLTKVWAESALVFGSKSFIPGFLGFRLVHNEGASFGMMSGATALFVIICAIVCAAIVIYMYKRKGCKAFECIIMGAIFAGALGNAFDRLVYGFVVDFLNFEFFSFPVFNIADCCITVGCVLWILFILFSKSSPFASIGDKDEKGARLEQDGEEAR